MSKIKELFPAKKQVPYFNYSEYEKTGIKPVDLVAQIVGYYRKVRIPLKTIYLKPKFFYQFEGFVRSRADEENFEEMKASGRQMVFDGVEIKKGSMLMLKDVYWDYYDNNKMGQA